MSNGPFLASICSRASTRPNIKKYMKESERGRGREKVRKKEKKKGDGREKVEDKKRVGFD